jgi:hypothetical protein
MPGEPRAISRFGSELLPSRRRDTAEGCRVTSPDGTMKTFVRFDGKAIERGEVFGGIAEAP